MHDSSLWEANKSFRKRLTLTDESRYKLKNQRIDRLGWMRNTFQSQERSVSLKEEGVQVKIAQSIATNKINTVVGLYKEAIDDLEEGMDSRISKAEESIIQNKRSQILIKSVEKMLKESATRNGVTSRQHETYNQSYRLAYQPVDLPPPEPILIKSISNNIRSVTKRSEQNPSSSRQISDLTNSLKILLNSQEKPLPPKPFYSLPKATEQKPPNIRSNSLNHKKNGKIYPLPVFDNDAIFKNRKLKYCTSQEWRLMKTQNPNNPLDMNRRISNTELEKESLMKLVGSRNSYHLELLVTNKNIYKRKGRVFHNP